MEKHPELTRRRIKKFISERVAPLMYGARRPLQVRVCRLEGEPRPAVEVLGREFSPCAVGARWGAPWGTTWFEFSAQVPARWVGREVVALVDLGFEGAEGFGCEGMVYAEDGTPVSAVNVKRQDVRLGERAGESVRFFVEAAANPTARWTWPSEDCLLPDYEGEPRFVLRQAALTTLNRRAWDLAWDLQFLCEALEVLPANTPRAGQLLYGLNRAVNVFDRTGGDLEAVRGAVRGLMSRRNGDTCHRVSAVGHAHIDTAWCWPLREAIRKCARTYATALQYMEEYPDYVFASSSALHYSWMKALYPSIFEGIKAAVARGQWEVVGSMWIEADCNIPSGESLVRQVTAGKRFFMEELGVETRDMWLPDVFGYSAAMPQILRRAGVENFLTQKISWNQSNTFPHHTFLWEGLDGSRVFAHFPPFNTYNGTFETRQVVDGVGRFQEHDRATCSLYPYGHGDGGGGPTREMLERARRMADFEGLPRVALETAAEFYERAREDAHDPAVWVGELTLELHRGTYTTQAWLKRANRKNEHALGLAELLDAVDAATSPSRLGERGSLEASAGHPRAVYETATAASPRARRGRVGALHRAWGLLLLNQFHDIIPGSSIHWVYQDARRDMAVVEALSEAVTEDALKTLFGDGAEEEGGALIAVNPHSARRVGVFPGLDGRPLWLDVPACGYARLKACGGGLPEGIAEVTLTEGDDGGVVLDNGIVEVRLDAQGALTGVTDHRAGREVLHEGHRGNVLQLHVDRPNFWDAWDVEPFHRETVEEVTALTSMSPTERGPLRAAVRVVRPLGEDSEWVQEVVLRAGSARIDFETRVQWRERHRLLKVAFPLAVRSQRATYAVQFGHVERPTHANTSWDAARFEVCAHAWADLSEPGYGVALLNDCKYGYDTRGHTMRLTLLRGSVAPDPLADVGEHRFTYALLPHSGDLREAGVIDEAYDLNAPLALHLGQGEALSDEHSWLSLGHPALVLSALKVSEDGQRVIIRCYEAFGGRGVARVRLGFPASEVWRCDLLERPEVAVELSEGGAFDLSFGPFELMTLAVPITGEGG